MPTRIKITQASADDAEEIRDLINLAYRGKRGWTRETNIVAGERASINDVMSLLKNNDTYMIIATKCNNIVACVCIESKEGKFYIGSFAVSPDLQNNGIGKEILRFSEEFAVNELGASELLMVVISQRKELIEFYERRGYKRTGKIEKYPVHLNVGIPLTEDLTVEYLVKYT